MMSRSDLSIPFRALAVFCSGTLLCSTIILAGCSKHQENRSKAEVSQKEANPDDFVKTVPIKKGRLSQEVIIPGRITFDPVHYRRVMSRVSALSTISIKAFPGDTVSKGQLLAVLRSRQFQTAEAEAVSVLESHRMNASGNRDLLSLALSKLRTLGASQNEIDRLIKTHKPSDRYEVRATIAGTIIKTGEIEGNQVHQGDWLFEISDLSHLWVDAYLYPGQERGITVGLPVSIRTLHPPFETIPAVITRVFPMADPLTRTIPIRISLKNPRHRFRPDLWVSVQIVPDLPQTGYIVPNEALFQNQAGTLQVFVKRGTGYIRLNVRKVAQNGREVLLEGPFLPDDLIVTEGLLRLRAMVGNNSSSTRK
ncbi:MAG: efflux RND transporter periplasmic adaptor subunit [Leptospirillum sp.]|jgi:Cu(I)/Ag(I) efflux system membrane fusion protein